MSRMSMGPGRALAFGLALGGMAVAGPTERAAAQVVVAPRAHAERQECRCVDRDGKPIERCTCFTLPDVDRIVTRAFSAVGGRARLGVTLASGPEAEGEARGARVESVLEDGPADRAGIREGDVITHLDGRSLLEPLDAAKEKEFDEDASLPVQRLMALARQIEPGAKVEVGYLRDGERRTATVEARDLDSWTLVAPRAPAWDEARLRERMQDLGRELGEMRIRIPREGRDIRIWTDSTRGPRVFFRSSPGEGGILAPAAPGAPRVWSCPGEDTPGGFVFAWSDRCIGGLQLVELNPGLASYFGTEKGVLVAAVHEESKLGLVPGDVVVAVGDREASDPDRLRRILSSYGPDESVTMRVFRQRRETSVTGTLGR